MLHFLFGLVAILAGLGLTVFGLFGRVPIFVGPSRAIPQAVAGYWKGRLACLGLGPIMILVGGLLVEEPFTQDDRRFQQAFDRAMTMAQTGRHDEALSALRAIEANDARQLAAVHATCGWVQTRQGKYDDAERDFAKAIESDDSLNWIYARQGEMYYRRDDLTRSRAALDRAIALSSQEPAYPVAVSGKIDYHSLTSAGAMNALFFRGLVNNDEAKYQEAVADFTAVLEKDPPTPIAGASYYVVSRCYRYLGQYDRAMETAQKAVTKVPGERFAHHSLGMAFAAKGKWPEARKSFEAYVQRVKKPHDGWNTLAWELATSSNADLLNPPLAIEYAERAVRETRREDANCLGTLAAAYARAGKFADAVEIQKQAIALKRDESSLKCLQLYEQNKPCTE